jgi:ferredoxin
MSDISEKFAQNVPGRFYVSCVCIGCNLCAEIAPANFRENTDLELAVGNSYVCRQPETPEEELHCREAMDTCPASAIRDDGDAEHAAIHAQGSRHFMKKDKERSCQ